MMISSRSSVMCGRNSYTKLAVRQPTVASASRRPLRVSALFGGGGGGGNPFDMKNLMESVKKAQQLVQVETQRVQQELANTEFEGYDEDETVRVVMTGNQEPRSVDLTQAAMDTGAEELSKRVTAAMKDAHTKSVAGMKDKMKDLAKTLGIPNPGALNM
ncbi:YbaB/EbfC DNA-binding family-domain-containing protein [Haematococcus lacustris]